MALDYLDCAVAMAKVAMRFVRERERGAGQRVAHLLQPACVAVAPKAQGAKFAVML